MAEESATSDLPQSSPEPLTEALARLLPRLRRHLSGARGLRGVDSDDLAQEVMARALRYGDSFDGAREPWPWLRRVAQRVVSDARAAAAREHVAGTDSHTAGETADRSPDALAGLDAREEVGRLLARLPERERDVLLRFHGQGHPVRVIARDLGLPEGTVKSHLHRARRRLAESNPGEQQHE